MNTLSSLDLSSLRLAWPLVLLLLPLPWLLARWQQRRRPWSPLLPPAAALRLPFADALPVSARLPESPGRCQVQFAGFLVFALLLLAAARPQWVDPADLRPASGRDVLLLLDVSASMQTRDLSADGVALSRLAAATRFGRAFLDRRPGDRAGLIVFASRPYLYVPLTYDLAAVGAALDSAEVGLAGEKTALGDALGLAVKTLSGASGEATSAAASPSASAPASGGAVAVLISDGANTTGALSPQQAAWLASQRRVRVHALGVGAAPDETALRALAEQTGGAYARASDAAGVGAFFARLDALEPTRRPSEPPTGSRRELYGLPLALAALLLLLRLAAKLFRQGSRRPAHGERPR